MLRSKGADNKSASMLYLEEIKTWDQEVSEQSYMLHNKTIVKLRSTQKINFCVAVSHFKLPSALFIIIAVWMFYYA